MSGLIHLVDGRAVKLVAFKSLLVRGGVSAESLTHAIYGTRQNQARRRSGFEAFLCLSLCCEERIHLPSIHGRSVPTVSNWKQASWVEALGVLGFSDALRSLPTWFWGSVA